MAVFEKLVLRVDDLCGASACFANEQEVGEAGAAGQQAQVEHEEVADYLALRVQHVQLEADRKGHFLHVKEVLQLEAVALLNRQQVALRNVEDSQLAQLAHSVAERKRLLTVQNRRVNLQTGKSRIEEEQLAQVRAHSAIEVLKGRQAA